MAKKQTAEYFRERRENKKSFGVLIDKEKSDQFEYFLGNVGIGKSQWLLGKIDEELGLNNGRQLEKAAYQKGVKDTLNALRAAIDAIEECENHLELESLLTELKNLKPEKIEEDPDE